nr:hypothetical protein [Angustibacter aerolatus]
MAAHRGAGADQRGRQHVQAAVPVRLGAADHGDHRQGEGREAVGEAGSRPPSGSPRARRSATRSRRNW